MNKRLVAAFVKVERANLSESSDYDYTDSRLNESHAYLLPALVRLLESVPWAERPKRVFDLGCGNGSVAAHLAARGFEVVGVDASKEGIKQANLAFPGLQLYLGSAYDDLSSKYGQFPVVYSLEVVEHVYYPSKYAACLFSLLEDGGTVVLSTPYHGYWKNLAISLLGKWDDHFKALWDHGHIKFWSIKTLRLLLKETGFKEVRFQRVGRIPILAKSMIAIARK